MNNRYSLEDTSITLGHRKSLNVSQTRHYHNFFEVLYIIEGSREVFASDRTYTLHRGDILLIPPESLHKSLDNRETSEIFSLYIPEKGVLTQCGIDRPVRFQAQMDLSNRIHASLRDMEREMKEKNEYFQSLIRSMTSEIEVILARYLKRQSGEKMSERDSQNGAAEIIEFIEEKFSEDLNLNRLSKNFYKSPSYLSRWFHRETGFTLVEYINQVRIKKARDYLRSTTHKVSTVSRLCGFGSITHFGRVFKEVCGVTPGDFRRNKQ